MIDLPKAKKSVDEEELAEREFAKENALDNRASILVGTKGGASGEEDDPYGETFYNSIRRWLKNSKQKVP